MVIRRDCDLTVAQLLRASGEAWKEREFHELLTEILADLKSAFVDS